MSYCRWSSMNWMCDVYCYEDCDGGWTTHVAARRRVREPAPDEEQSWTDFYAEKITAEEYVALHKQTMDDLESIELANIGLPHDDETFNDPSLETFRGRLTMLKKAGYIIPEYVFDSIAEEIAIRDGEYVQ